MERLTSGVSVRLIGPPGIRIRDRLVAPATRKGALLLYYLAVEDRPVPRPELAELLWGSARAPNLRQELYTLAALDGADTWLEAGADVVLHAASDLRTFRKLAAAKDFEAALACVGARAGSPVEVPRLLEGVDATSVPSYEDWLQVERARFEGEVRDVLQEHAQELETAGRAAAAVDVLQRLLASDPLNETAHRAVMRLELRRGRFQAALAQYDRCRKVLHEQLGVEPLPETLELARHVTRTRDVAAVPETAAVGVRRMPTTLLRPPVLVGREEAWQTMERAWQDRKTIFLSGPPGVGKTRLMLDFARSKGGFLLMQGFPADREVPYASADRAIGLVRRSMPEVRVPQWAADALTAVHRGRLPLLEAPDDHADGAPRVPLEQAWMELMDAVVRRVATLPGDDVQDFDPATAELAMALTRYVARRTDAPLAGMLAAFRADEADPAFLESVEAAVDAGVAVWIRLEPLGPEDVGRLIAESGVPSSGDDAARVHAYAGGNPLFVLEVLKGMWLSTAAADDDEGRVLAPTERLRVVVGRRLRRLSAGARSVLDALAILAPDTSMDLVAAVAERPVRQVASGLAELEGLQLVDGAHLVHGLVQDVVLADMSYAELRYRHRLAAAAFRDGGADPARVATHYEKAGEWRAARQWWEQAAAAYRAAGLSAGAAHAQRRIERLRARAADAPARPDEGEQDRGPTST